MPYFYFDWTWMLLIPAMLLALWANSLVKSTFRKFAKVKASSGLTGAEVAKRLLDANGLSTIPIEVVSGQLSDHYDPRKRILRLSGDVANSRSVSAIGVAAHEVGHAIQHQNAYGAFELRQTIFPVARLGSQMAMPLFIGGLFFYGPLMDIGIILFSAAVVFQLVTLPVEFDASKRALALLDTRGYLVQQEVGQARKVLRAAALTYVAATAVAVLQLLRLLILRGARD